MSVATKAPKADSLSREEVQRDFDLKTQAALHVSGEDFVRALHEGKYNAKLDDPDSSVPYLAMLSRVVHPR